jgi:hypothetical protein
MESGGVDFFLAQHANVHAAIQPGMPSLEDFVCNRLSDAQMRRRPEGHNSVAYLLWHATRFEDVIVNACLHDEPEVLDREGWLPRLGVERRDVGVAWGPEAVDDFSFRVDVAALRAYRAAVARRTRASLTPADLADLDRPVLGAGGRASAAGALGPGAEWVAEAMDELPRAWLVSYSLLGHCYFHLGEAEHVARLVGRPGP